LTYFDHQQPKNKKCHGLKHMGCQGPKAHHTSPIESTKRKEMGWKEQIRSVECKLCLLYGSDLEASLWVADYMKNEILLTGDKLKKNQICSNILHGRS
jgi:hypothetical protein